MRIRRWGCGLASALPMVGAIVLASGATADGAIINTQAGVSTTVQELIDGVPGSVNSDSAEGNLDEVELPISATARLTSTDLEGRLASVAQGFSEFSDPTRWEQPNPEEFAIETACYSNMESIAYSVNGAATEFRTIVFTTPGNPLAPPEIEFDADGVRTIESRIFLSGAVVMWSTEGGQSLDDLLAELQITVRQDDGASPVFRTTVTIAGDGVDGVRVNEVGPIRVGRISLEDLADQGLDPDSLAILEQVEAAGVLIVLAIPEQEHSYDYPVRADETTILTAEFAANLQNAPGGTGIAAVLGRPFENLADFMAQGLPGVDGAALQRTINKELAARRIGPVPSGRGSPVGLCGAFGAEAILGVGLFLALTFSRPRRH